MKLISLFIGVLIAALALAAVRADEELSDNQLKAKSAEFHELLEYDKDVTTLESGLQFKVKARSGKTVKPKDGDTVKVHFIGKIARTGTVYANTYIKSAPVTLAYNAREQGWTEALKEMNLSDKFEVWQIGFGADGRPPLIPPYSSIIFEVELIAVQPKVEL